MTHGKRSCEELVNKATHASMCPRYPEPLKHRHTPFVRFIMVFHDLSTEENFLLSSGSWRLMSSAAKMV